MTRSFFFGLVPAAALLVLSTVLAGCGVARVEQATPDTFETWSLTPLPPDPALASLALAEQSVCRSGTDEPIRIAVQDRRTASTAGFLMLGATTFGGCIITSAGGPSGGGIGPLPEAMTGPLSIDDNGGGGPEGSEVRELGGRIVGPASVKVQLADGRVITASVQNGYWLAWWPGKTLATQVVATDASGADIATVQVPS